MNKSSPLYVLTFMATICVVFGAGVAMVHYATLGIMKENDALLQSKRLASAFVVDVEGSSAEAYRSALLRAITEETPGAGPEAPRSYRKIAPPDSGAVGFVFSGIGFWDVIRGILVVSPDLSQIVNIEFLSQSETPGLGARIEEEWFKKQFRGLPVDWSKPEDKRIIIGPAPNPQARNRVDAIAGATQTSIALMKTINAALQQIATDTNRRAPSPSE